MQDLSASGAIVSGGASGLGAATAGLLAGCGLRVNAIAPGPVDTAMAKAVHTPTIRADYHDHVPLNRYGLETELANAIYFLCSEQASYITGQVLPIDGGMVAVMIDPNARIAAVTGRE